MPSESLRLQAFLSDCGDALTENKLVGLYGDGASGKTSLLRALTHIASTRLAWVKNFNSGKLASSINENFDSSLALREPMALSGELDGTASGIRISEIKVLAGGLKSCFIQHGIINCPNCREFKEGLKSLTLEQTTSLVRSLKGAEELLVVSPLKNRATSHRALMKQGVSQILIDGEARMLGDLDSVPEQASAVRYAISSSLLGSPFSRKILFEESYERAASALAQAPLEVWIKPERSSNFRKLFTAGQELFCPRCGSSYNFSELLQEHSEMKLGGLTLDQLQTLSLSELAKRLKMYTVTDSKADRKLARFLELALTLELGDLLLTRQVSTLSSAELFLLGLIVKLCHDWSGKLFTLDHPLVYLGTHDFEGLLNVLHTITVFDNTIIVADAGLNRHKNFDLLVRAPHQELRAGTAVNAVDFKREPLFPNYPVEEHDIKETPILKINCEIINGRTVTLSVPLRKISVITGSLGTGKTDLIKNNVYASFTAIKKNSALPERVKEFSFSGSIGRAAYIERIYNYENKRSRVYRLIELDQALAEHFAKLEDSRMKGIRAKDFIEGRSAKSKRSIDRITYKERTYQEYLNLTLEQLSSLLAHLPGVGESLRYANCLGLSQLHASRELSSLSLCEFQMLYLASSLKTKQHNTLFILERPASGLSPSSSSALVNLIRKEIISLGHSVIAEESDPVFIELADWRYGF